MTKCFISLACAGLVLASFSAAADDDIWKAGINQYVRFASKNGSAPPNQQPVNLQPQQIRDALMTIQIWQKNFLKSDQARQVFSSGQAAILGQALAKGLARARPDQDIIFALARRNKHFLGIESLTYMAGRAFYANDRLNVIIGDYDRPPDKLKESAYGSAGITEVQYFFSHGRRSSASNFKKGIIGTDGVSTHQGRPDWLVINLATAAATYAAENQPKPGEGGNAASSAAVQEEAARLAQERRELRLEMARLKKQMSESGKGGGETVEERLKTLKDLRDKKLITEEEYAKRRKQILDQI